MRRLQWGVLALTLPLLTLSLMMAGCGGKEKEDDGPPPPKKGKTGNTDGSGKPKTGSTLKAVEAKGTGTLKGKITVKGDATGVYEQLTKGLQTQIAGSADKDKCLAGTEEEKTEQEYRIGDNKQLGNVLVWIQPEKGYYFPISDKQLEEAKKHNVVIDQPHCAFQPHVSTLFPQYADPKNPSEWLPTGQILIVKNSAPMNHNTKWQGGPLNLGDNKTIGKGEELKIDNLVPEGKPILVKCNIHGWMDAYVGVFGHPYATVSRSDTAPKDLQAKKSDASFGTYEIKGVPTGVKLRILAWHERGNFLTATTGDEIELKDGETTKDFEVEVKP